MLGFGATFGFTVMNRISLFVNRVQYLWNDWLANTFNIGGINPNADSWYQLIFWLVIAIFVVYAVMEFLRKDQKPASA